MYVNIPTYHWPYRPWGHGHVCPACGHCQNCGRGGPVVVFPVPQPVVVPQPVIHPIVVGYGHDNYGGAVRALSGV